MMGLLYRAADRLRQRRYKDNHGRIGEDLAHRFLLAQGCTLVARNYRTLSGRGEIDLVVWDGARLAFVDGATHMGGVLKQKRMGDLQTQINGLTPFLTRYGLTYAQFKDLVQASGITLYDEYGRIIPDSLRKFSGVH